MKIKIQRKNSADIFHIEIPSYLNTKQLSVGEKFIVFVAEEKEKIPLEVCFIADKKSILLGDRVVRLSNLKSLDFFQFNLIRPVEPKKSFVTKGFGQLKSPMTGKVISVAVKNDDHVRIGDILVVIEAMKMENRILAEVDGIVKNSQLKIGSNVVAGDCLLTLVQKNTP